MKNSKSGRLNFKPSKKYAIVYNLLHEIIETSCRALIAIDEKQPHSEICNIAVEELDELTKQVSSAILGDSASFLKSDGDVVEQIVMPD